MSGATIWHFYHISRKKKYGPFSFEQLCSIFSKNQIKDDQILIYKKGWDKWQSPLVDPQFQEFFNPKPLDATEDKVINSEIKIADINAELNSIVILGKKSFKTKTLYLGEESIILQHTLPHFFKDQTFQLFIKSPDNRTSIKLNAKFLEHENEIILIEIENSFSQKIYERWLNYFKEKNDQVTPLKKSA